MYDLGFSVRKVEAVRAMLQEIEIIKALKAKGGKELLKQNGYKGNQPKMALRGLRSLLLSTDDVFADLLEQYEGGKLTPYQLAEKARSRTEKIGKAETFIHSDTIHHANPLEIGDALTDLEPEDLYTLLQEEFDTRGGAFGDSTLNVRGNSYTTRGHLNQSANPRGRYKAVNEFSEPGVTAISAHPRGPNDPLLKAPIVKPKTLDEAREYLDSIRPLTEESRALGAYADKDVRKVLDNKAIERGIILPGDTLYRNDLPTDIQQAAKKSFDNLADEIDAAKAFKTPKVQIVKGVAKFIPGDLDNLIIGGVMAAGAAGTTLLSGGSPAEAKDNAVNTGLDVATGDIDGGTIAPGTVKEYGGGDARTQYELENRGQPLPPFVPEAPVDSEANATRKILEQNAAIARERGSRMKFQLGSVSIGLPEFGLSELLGMNK